MRTFFLFLSLFGGKLNTQKIRVSGGGDRNHNCTKRTIKDDQMNRWTQDSQGLRWINYTIFHFLMSLLSSVSVYHNTKMYILEQELWFNWNQHQQSLCNIKEICGFSLTLTSGRTSQTMNCWRVSSLRRPGTLDPAAPHRGRSLGGSTSPASPRDPRSELSAFTCPRSSCPRAKPRSSSSSQVTKCNVSTSSCRYNHSPADGAPAVSQAPRWRRRAD